MNNRPHGNELLSAARKVLLDELLPLLPTDKTYDVLMVANAMAIAARELQPHGEHDAQADQAIAAFYSKAGLAGRAQATEEGLSTLIKARQIESPHHKGLHDLLLALTQAKLALSNPKYLR